MTNYTFRCGVCGVTVARRRRFGDSTPPPCPECGGEMQTVITPPLSIRLAWKPSVRQPALTRPNRSR